VRASNGTAIALATTTTPPARVDTRARTQGWRSLFGAFRFPPSLETNASAREGFAAGFANFPDKKGERRNFAGRVAGGVNGSVNE